MKRTMDKDEVYKAGIRFPNEVCSPWDMVKAIEWAMDDHIKRFHCEVEEETHGGENT